MQSYDAIIIGSGQAGPSLAKRLAGAGQRVAIIERESFGGTCINTGCTPTKTMVASAYAAHMARRAAEFGVVVGGGVSVDMRRVKQRKDAIVASWSAATEASLRATENCTVYRGHARFVAPHELEVGSERLAAERGLHQCRRQGFGAGDSRHRPRAIPHQHHRARAGGRSGAPRRPRRQLCRTGIRADLPPLRRRGHRAGKLAAACAARGRGDLRRDPCLPGERRRAHRLRRRRRGRGAGAAWRRGQCDA